MCVCDGGRGWGEGRWSQQHDIIIKGPVVRCIVMAYALLIVSVPLFTKQTEDAFSSSVNSIAIDLNILTSISFEPHLEPRWMHRYAIKKEREV